MTNYWDPQFLKHLKTENIKYVCEVGARYGDESIYLSKLFKNAKILSFECNPNTVNKCMENLKSHNNIKFFNIGLGENEYTMPFYSYIIDGNDGASSFHKRIDFENTQKLTGYINIKTLKTIVNEENIPYVDLLCMDIQGYELNVLKGCGDFIKNIKYIIMEEPKPIINTEYLPNGIHSKYINSPTSIEINEFMTKNNFIEIERINENIIEDNVMYINKSLFN